MMVYHLPGDMIVGRIRHSIYDLLRVSDLGSPQVGPLADFKFVVIAQGLTEAHGPVQVIGIVPVKESGKEQMISVVRWRKNVEPECEVTEMLDYLKKLAKDSGMDRIYYTARQADTRVEKKLLGTGFEYETQGIDQMRVAQGNACTEMVLDVKLMA